AAPSPIRTRRRRTSVVRGRAERPTASPATSANRPAATLATTLPRSATANATAAATPTATSTAGTRDRRSGDDTAPNIVSHRERFGRRRRDEPRPRHRRRRRSAFTTRAALWPGAPITPPPGCVPEPQRYSPRRGVR